MNDLKKDGNFKILILTHNFDFYRTVVSRLETGGNNFFADKKSDRSVKICEGLYNTDILKNRFLRKITQRRAFIPSGREMMEMGSGGYINIVMRRDQTLGWRGDVSAEAGVSDDWSERGSGSVSFASKKFDMTIDAHGRRATQTTDDVTRYHYIDEKACKTGCKRYGRDDQCPY